MEEKREFLEEKKNISFYTAQALEDKTWIPFLIETLEDETAIKYFAEKIVREISETHPDLLSPYIDKILPFLQSKNHFIQWGFIITIAHLMEAGEKEIWPQVKDVYYSFLRSNELIAFGNTVSVLDKILKKYKEEEKTLLPILLETHSHVFLHKGEVSDACREVATGHVIDFFTKIYKESSFQKEMVSFVKESLDSSKESTRRKAKYFLKAFQAE